MCEIKKRYCILKVFIPVVCVVFFTGCESRATSTETEPAQLVSTEPEFTSSPQDEPEVNIPHQTETLRLQQCRKELEAYQTLSSNKQKGYQHTFDALMQEASKYSGIRAGVGSDTQETVDALYRYRVNRLCAEIHQALMIRLAERGEQVK